jgi:hypothetical protein
VRRKKKTFDLLRASVPQSERLLFGGDVMLGRSCAAKIDRKEKILLHLRARVVHAVMHFDYGVLGLQIDLQRFIFRFDNTSSWHFAIT